MKTPAANTDNNTKLLYPKLSYKLQGIFFDIRKQYGPGQKETVYQNLIEEKLASLNIPFEKEPRIKIYSQESKKVVGTYQPDFSIDEKIIIEVKSSRLTTRTDEKQLYHYLRNSKYELGFLVNFSTPRLYIKRIIYTNDHKPFLETRINTNGTALKRLTRKNTKSA